MKKVIVSLLVVLALVNNSISQGEAAVPFLQIGPSPQLGGSAGTYAVLPTTDTYGFYYNPAQLGNFAEENNFSVHFYPSKINWLPQFNFNDLTLNSKALAIGLKIPGEFEKYNLCLGLGYMHTLLNLGENVWTDDAGFEIGSFDSKEFYDAFSVGLHFEYFFEVNIGISYKSIISKLTPVNVKVGVETEAANAKKSAFDIGLQLTVPLIQSTGPIGYFGEDVSPFIDLHVGLAFTNLGGKITYLASQKNPLPRQLKTGIGTSLGLKKSFDDFEFQIIRIDFGHQATDLLVESRDYQSIPGDINLIENVILGESDNKVDVHTSWSFNILETISIAEHRFKGPGYPEFVKNSTFHFGSAGIFKFLYANGLLNQGLDFLRNVDVRYSQTKTSVKVGSPLDGTKYRGISITLSGLQDLIF